MGLWVYGFMGGLNSLDGLWVDWIFRGSLADGGRADTLFLILVRVCENIYIGCPPVRPVYPFLCQKDVQNHKKMK